MSLKISFFLFFAIVGEAPRCLAANSPDDSLERKELRVAFLLPFLSDKVFITDLGESSFYFPAETQVSVEFYQGALLALDSLKKRGLNATIYVFDCGKDSATIESTLRKPELKEADLIIGPLSGYALKEAADFAKRDSIPFLSPLSATYYPSEPNPYFFLANATMETHCRAVYDYLLNHELTTRKFMIYRKRPQNTELVKYFKQYEILKKSEGSMALKFIEMTDSTLPSYLQLKDSLFITQKNIIIVPSNEESFVRNMMRKISNLHGEYQIQVFGMPTWRNFDLIPPEQWDSSNTIITSSYCLDKSLPAAERFKNEYLERFNVNPTEYSLRGYDETLYYISALMYSNDTSLASFIGGTTRQIATSYKIGAVTKDNMEICYFTNLAVYFLKNENGEWVKLK